MKEIIGDFWQLVGDKNIKWDAICCTTNGIIKNTGELVMGGGIAKDFSSRFSALSFDWGTQLSKYYQRYGKKFGPIVLVSEHPDSIDEEGITWLVSFPTKNHWRDKSDIQLIKRSTRLLLNIVNAFGWNNILMTRPGCGMGGLNWNDVRIILNEYFDDRFYIVNKE